MTSREPDHSLPDDAEPTDVSTEMSTEVLTPAERAAFDALEREAPVGDLLEARTVGALRRRGLLGDRPAEEHSERSGPPKHSDGRRGPRRALLAALAAAIAAVVFLAGFALGQHTGVDQAAEQFLVVRQQDAALRVQEAGSAYLAALADLEAGDRGATAGDADGPATTAGVDPAVVAQGREVALSVLRGAAEELARMNPDDPRLQRLARLLDDEAPGVQTARRDGGETPGHRQVIWF